MNTTINVRPQILPTYGENSCPRDAGETRMSSDLSSSLHLDLYLRIRPPGTYRAKSPAMWLMTALGLQPPTRLP
jgi:hypothetical protein